MIANHKPIDPGFVQAIARRRMDRAVYLVLAFRATNRARKIQDAHRRLPQGIGSFCPPPFSTFRTWNAAPRPGSTSTILHLTFSFNADFALLAPPEVFRIFAAAKTCKVGGIPTKYRSAGITLVFVFVFHENTKN
jgi:hypothetical protein